LTFGLPVIAVMTSTWSISCSPRGRVELAHGRREDGRAAVLERVDDAEPVAVDAEQLVEAREPVLEHDRVLRLRVGAVEDAEGARASGRAGQDAERQNADPDDACRSKHGSPPRGVREVPEAGAG
jgi:hypothetical protein